MSVGRQQLPEAAGFWVLALGCAPAGMVCFLSDGESRFEHAQAPWPARGDDAPLLPAPLLDVLVAADARSLRLQVDEDLDVWPWEVEIERACHDLAISRHLGKAATVAPPSSSAESTPAGPVPLGSGSVDDPLWFQGGASRWTSQAREAQEQGRAFIALSADLPAQTARSLRHAVRLTWGGEPSLSSALHKAATALDLPRAGWRVYGEMRFAGSATADESSWRQVTSLSIDLVESTAILAAMGAEGYAQAHAEFHRLCRQIVQAHAGRLDDPQGDDGLMAYFGLQPSPADAAWQAVSAACALVAEVPGVGFSVRIGLATGRLAVAAGQPFGLEIHLAARLQRAAAADSILVSDRTRALLGDRVSCEPVAAPLMLGGFDAPQVAHRVLALVGAQATRVGHSVQGRFVGRARELAALLEAWQEVCTFQRGVYRCVVGEPGIGKSRLLAEFESALRFADCPPVVFAMTGQPHLQSSAFAALAPALQVPALQHLAALLRPAPSGEAEPAHQRQHERERQLNALVAGFLDLARRLPLCCIVDDAQWLDPSTNELVESIRTQSRQSAILWVVSLREDLRDAEDGCPGDERIVLRGLDNAASVELVRALASARTLTPQVHQLIADRAAGVPLFVEETVRVIEQSQRDPLALLQGIPPTLDDLLMARLDALGPARGLAQLASVLGIEFQPALWLALLEESDEWIQRVQSPGAWPRLLDSGLLIYEESTRPRYRFRHALIRDAAYESVWLRDRKRLHAVVARVMERRPDCVDSVTERRGDHLCAAGKPDEAFMAWSQAARESAAAAADRESLALARRALALLPQLADTSETRHKAMQLHLLEAARCIALDGYGAASVESAYLRAAALCSDAPGATRTRVELGLEACYAMRGDLARARVLAESAIRHTPWDANLRLALQARWAWVNVVFHQGELTAALEMAEQCLARYEPALHQPGAVQDPAIMCLCYGAWGLFERGCASQSRVHVQRVLLLAQTLDHPFSHAVAQGFAASVALFCGDHELGLQHADEALRRCTASTFQAWLAHAKVIRGRLRAALGDARAGLAEMQEGYALWTATGARITCATYLAFQAEVRLLLDEPREALQCLATAQDIARRHGERYHAAELLRLQGLATWRLDPTRDGAQLAQRLLEQALALAREQGKGGFVLRSALTLGRVLAAQGEPGRAAEGLRQACEAVPDHRETADYRDAQTALREWSTDSQQGETGASNVAI